MPLHTRFYRRVVDLQGLISAGIPWHGIMTASTSNRSRPDATSGIPDSVAAWISTPVVIDGELFNALELGIAFADPDTAIAHAISHIDRFGRRYATAG